MFRLWASHYQGYNSRFTSLAPVPLCPPQISQALCLGLNQGFRGKKPATKILSHGTALENIRMSSLDIRIFCAVILAHRLIYDTLINSLFLPRVCLSNTLGSRYVKQYFRESSEYFWGWCTRRFRLIFGYCLYPFSKTKPYSETCSVDLSDPTPLRFVQPVQNTGPGFETLKRPIKIPLFTSPYNFMKNSNAVFQTLEGRVMSEMLVKNRAGSHNF
jgi:hypothetical protein